MRIGAVTDRALIPEMHSTKPKTVNVGAISLLLVCAIASAEVPTGSKLADTAIAQVGVTTVYDPKYVKLAYPGGDLPMSHGVCSDVVVRAFRAIGVDLQIVVHEDMTRSFASYPKMWGLRAPDRNIDHRRLPTLLR